MSQRHPTAQRIVREALRLFAVDGIAGTPIVRIEQAAGLAPGSGAFYRHFRNKAAVLEAAVDDAAASAAWGAEVQSTLAGLPLDQQVQLIARGTWALFDAQRDLMLVLVRGTAPLPSNYGHDANAFPGIGVSFLSEWMKGCGNGRTFKGVADHEATALVLLDALTFYWMQHEGESLTPYGVDSQRFIDAWCNLVVGLTR